MFLLIIFLPISCKSAVMEVRRRSDDSRPVTSSSRPSSAALAAGVLIDWEAGRQEIEDEETRLLLRKFFEFTRLQRAEEKELEAECLQLEMEQCKLWYQLLASDNTSSRGRLSVVHPELEVKGGGPRDVVGEEDEFDDAWMMGDDSSATGEAMSWPRGSVYLYGEPEGAGQSYPVKETKDLFRIVSDEGMWCFYNDSQKYIMNVRISVHTSSEIGPGPKAKVHLDTPRKNETLYEALVQPGETQVLLFGSPVDFTNHTEPIPVTPSFRNSLAQQSDTCCEEEVRRLSELVRKRGPDLNTDSIIGLCRETSIPFIDCEFPPVGSSIYRGDADDYFLWPLPWKRPASYLSAKDVEGVRLFRGSIKGLDPHCGDGNNEYFCSAARIAASEPEYVYSLFRHPCSVEDGKRERQQHAYRITLHFNGWWQCTVVDDFLPASRRGPAFGRCNTDIRKLWYPLLEKAYAKMCGSYAAIQRGCTLDALQLFLGFPCSSFDNEWMECKEGVPKVAKARSKTLFTLIEQRLAGGHTVLCHAPASGSTQWGGFSIGLNFGSSCVVSHTVRHEDYWLLQIRCPTLSPLQWDGRWCSESIRWKQEPEVAAKCYVSQGKFDCVWMEWSEALRLFSGCGICYTSCDSSCHLNVRGTFSTPGAPSVSLKVIASEPFEAYIVLTQHISHRKEDGPIFPIGLVMAELQKETLVPTLYSTSDADAPAASRSSKSGGATLVRSPSCSFKVSLKASSTPYYIMPIGDVSEKAAAYTLGVVPKQVNSVNASQISFVDMRGVSGKLRRGDAVPMAKGQPSAVKAECQKREKGKLISFFAEGFNGASH